jgi:hypothetical protein
VHGVRRAISEAISEAIEWILGNHASNQASGFSQSSPQSFTEIIRKKLRGMPCQDVLAYLRRGCQ